MRAGALFAFVAASGCVERFELDPGRFECRTDLECAAGFVCDPNAEVCVAEGRGLDAGGRDAAPEDGAPGDGGSVEDAGADDAGMEERLPRPEPHASEARTGWWYPHLAPAEALAEAARLGAWITNFELESAEPLVLAVALEPEPTPPIPWFLVTDRAPADWSKSPDPASGAWHAMVDYEPYSVGGEGRLAELWIRQPRGFGWTLHHLGAADDWNAHGANRGPVDLVARSSGGISYLGHSARKNDGHRFEPSASEAELRALDAEGRQVLRLDLVPGLDASAPRVLAISRPIAANPGRIVRLRLRLVEVDELAYEGGYRVVELAPYRRGTEWRYAAIFEDGLDVASSSAAVELRQVGRFAWSMTATAAPAVRAGFMEHRRLGRASELRPLLLAAVAHHLASGGTLAAPAPRFRPRSGPADDCLEPAGTTTLGAAVDALLLGEIGAARSLVLGLGVEAVNARARGLTETSVDEWIECPGHGSGTSTGDLTRLLLAQRAAGEAWFFEALGRGGVPGVEARLQASLGRALASLSSAPATVDRILGGARARGLSSAIEACAGIVDCLPATAHTVELEIPLCGEERAYVQLAVVSHDRVVDPSFAAVDRAVAAFVDHAVAALQPRWRSCRS